MNFNRYFVKKPVSLIQEESERKSLDRTLSASNLVSLGVGCIIGAGIFVMTGKAAADHAGPAIILSFVFAGIACVLAALCYAELASILPVSGSAYTYTYVTLGESIAWVMGWLLILEYGLAAATVSVGWSGYVVSLLKDMGVTVPPGLASSFFEAEETTGNLVVAGHFNLPAFIGIMVLTFLLYLGIKESARVNNIIVAVKVTVVITFIVVGAFYVHPELWSPFIPDYIPSEIPGGEGKYGFDGVLRAASIIFFAYIGFEAVSTAAQEARNPQRDIPVGILGSLVICTVLYILVCAVLTGIVSYTQLSVPDPMAVAVDAIGLGWFSFFIKIGAVTGLTSVMLVLLYGQTRIFYVMSCDGLLPEVFSRIHSRFHTPYINTWIVGTVVALAGGVVPIKVLGDMVSLGTLLAFSVVCFSVMYLRYKHPGLHRPFRCPGMPFVPIAGMLLCLYLISGMPWETFYRIKWWFFAGIVIYLAYGQFKSRMGKCFREGKGDEVLKMDDKGKEIA